MSTNTNRNTGQTPAVSIAYLIAGVVLTILAGIAYILLRDDNDARSGLMLYALPIITGLFVAAKVEQTTTKTDNRLSEQDQQLNTIAENVNGNLTLRMKNIVAEALAERDAATTAAIVKHTNAQSGDTMTEPHIDTEGQMS